VVGIVYAELSMSLDGYIAGPNVGTALPLGEHGELLHEWMWRGRTDAETTAFEETYFGGVGALIMGRRMVDVGMGPWGENPTFHAPCFVVIHRPGATVTKQG
jgi:dihydrofolate reductase